MRFAFWVNMAKDTHSEYATLNGFPQQEWLRERASILPFTYIACQVSLKVGIKILSLCLLIFTHTVSLVCGNSGCTHPLQAVLLLCFQFTFVLAVFIIIIIKPVTISLCHLPLMNLQPKLEQVCRCCQSCHECRM